MKNSTCMSKAFARRMVVWTGIVTLLVLFAFYPSAASGTKSAGLVTIVTSIQFITPPFDGTFEVSEGVDILGCLEGVFVDTPQGNIKKEFTCLSGPGEGDTFTVRCDFGRSHANGHWRVVEGTGFFATLHGQGDFSLELVDPNHGIETLTGKVHFDPN